jgi:hypothetical protein
LSTLGIFHKISLRNNFFAIFHWEEFFLAGIGSRSAINTNGSGSIRIRKHLACRVWIRELEFRFSTNNLPLLFIMLRNRIRQRSRVKNYMFTRVRQVKRLKVVLLHLWRVNAKTTGGFVYISFGVFQIRHNLNIIPFFVPVCWRPLAHINDVLLLWPFLGGVLLPRGPGRPLAPPQRVREHARQAPLRHLQQEDERRRGQGEEGLQGRLLRRECDLQMSPGKLSHLHVR